MTISRRDFNRSAAAGLAAPVLLGALGGMTGSPQPLVIRTITAGASLRNIGDHQALERAAAFLQRARARFEEAGAVVQTLRIATNPLPRFLPDWTSAAGLDALKRLDRMADSLQLSLCLGPVIEEDRDDAVAPEALAELVRTTSRLNFSMAAAPFGGTVQPGTIATAARTIKALSRVGTAGDGNFRFAAAAQCAAGIPFFPGAWHEGAMSFALGLQSPRLLSSLIRADMARDDARRALIAGMNAAFAPLAALALLIEQEEGVAYRGIDSSPAPGLDASIGGLIETLSGVPFGDSATLSACGLLTDALKGLAVRTCGFSGLMLPTLEDPVLARRAAEGRFGLAHLLLFSSVCGAGLDVAPLPGDVSEEALVRIITDVAVLASKYNKPLLARLLPIPGKSAGDPVTFDHPLLTASTVMAA